MPTLEEVQEQIKAIPGTKGVGKRETKELPSILWEGECIEGMVEGRHDERMGVLIATNKRVMFVNKGMMSGLTVSDFPYDKISSIEYETGMLTGKLKIFASGHKVDIDLVQKDRLRTFAEYVRARTTGISAHASAPATEAPAAAPPPSPQVSGDDDTLSKLERLGKLKEQGILTEEEFLREKQKILG